MQRIVLVLPQPDSPRSTRDSPSGTTREISSTATKSSYLRVSPLISMSTEIPSTALIGVMHASRIQSIHVKGRQKTT